MAVEPAAVQEAGPYRSATLQVGNRSGTPVRAVAVRMREGGPTFLFPVSLPPDANASLAVALPVAAIEQTYRLRALAGESGDAPVISAKDVSTTWAAERVDPRGFLDAEPYYRHEDKTARWPAGLLRNLLLAAAVACIALLSAVFVRPRAWRLAVVGLLAASASVTIILVLRAGPPVAIVQYETVAAAISADANAPPATEIVLTCLRTTRWTHPSADVMPLYRSVRQMADDDAVIHPQKGLSLTIRPGQMRVFLAHRR